MENKIPSYLKKEILIILVFYFPRWTLYLACQIPQYFLLEFLFKLLWIYIYLSHFYCI